MEELKKKHKELTEKINAILLQAKPLQQELAATEQQIYLSTKDELHKKLKNKAEPFGKCSIGGVSFDVPKKVEWNQDFLAEKYKEIGKTAFEYIDVKYSVKESKYKAWPEAIKKEFDKARTVSEGKLKLTIEEKE